MEVLWGGGRFGKCEEGDVHSLLQVYLSFWEQCGDIFFSIGESLHSLLRERGSLLSEPLGKEEEEEEEGGWRMRRGGDRGRRRGGGGGEPSKSYCSM